MVWYRSFRTRILVASLSMMVAIIVMISAVIITKTQSDIEKNVLDNNRQLVLTLKKTLDTYFLELKYSMEIIAWSEQVRSMDFKRIDPLLQKIVTINPSISQMYVMNQSGMQFYKTSYLETLGDRSDREYFQKAIQGETFISEVIVSRSTNKPISTLAVPIFNDGEIVGVLGASIEFDQINQIVESGSISKNEYAFIVFNMVEIILEGTIDCTSKEGEGVYFKLNFPKDVANC